MVGPIRESLEKLDRQAADIETKRVGAYEGLTAQVASLQRVAGSLSDALRSPNIRGQWAEQELGNILELAGLNQHIDYYPQHSVPVPGGVLRPDAVVSVPGGLKVVIDAKAPLDNYLKAHEATDENQETALADQPRRRHLEACQEPERAGLCRRRRGVAGLRADVRAR